MQKALAFLIFLNMLFCYSEAIGQTQNLQNSLTLTPYFNAQCENITGTWQGFYTDTNDLFGNGPWPLTMSLMYQNGQMIGQVNNVLYNDMVTYGTVEDKILTQLQKNHKIGAEVLKDEWKEWFS